MGEVAVRLANEQDTDAIVALWRVLAAFHEEIAPHVWTLTSDAEELYRRYLSQMIQDADRRVFIARLGGQTVGYLVAGKGQRPPVLVPSVRGVCEEICVAPAARRRGVGKALVAEAMAWFRREGVLMVEVGYATDNPISGPFWQSQGFRPYRVTAACFFSGESREAALRSVTEDDVPALVSLVADLPEWFHKGVPEEVRLDCTRCAGLVAEVDGAIVGFVLWLKEGEAYEIKWLAVVRERHRQGIGSLLIDGLMHAARETGAERILVDTLAPTHDYEPYARTRAFYEAREFRLSGIERGGFPEGSDKATYALHL